MLLAHVVQQVCPRQLLQQRLLWGRVPSARQQPSGVSSLLGGGDVGLVFLQTLQGLGRVGRHAGIIYGTRESVRLPPVVPPASSVPVLNKLERRV